MSRIIVVRDHQFSERGGASASCSAIFHDPRGSVRVRAVGTLGPLETETGKYQARLPALSGFGRAIQSLCKSSRGLANAFQVSHFPPAPTGLVTCSDGHRVSERKPVNVRKGVGEIQHVQR